MFLVLFLSLFLSLFPHTSLERKIYFIVQTDFKLTDFFFPLGHFYAGMTGITDYTTPFFE